MEKREDVIKETEKIQENDVKDEKEDINVATDKEEEETETADEKDLVEDEAKDQESVDESAELNQQIEDLNNKLMRLQADFINYKNRVEREKKNIYSYALEDIFSQLLPVLDNFERALNSMEKDNSYYEGVKMIYDQMLDVLKKNGLKEIDCLDKPFDPNFHHAVISEDSDKEEGTILEVFQKGYMLNDKVIRPSMVKVAK
ncbi:MAG: nucleotide exchange factor GrpE [Tissierellales bacterium]